MKKITRRAAVATLASIPALATIPGIVARERPTQPRWLPLQSFGEWLTEYDRKYDGPPMEFCDVWARAHWDCHTTEDRDWQSLAYVAGSDHAQFTDATLTALWGFTGDGLKARKAFFDIFGAVAAAGLLAIGTAHTPDFRSYFALILGTESDLRPAVEERAAKWGIAWGDWRYPHDPGMA